MTADPTRPAENVVVTASATASATASESRTAGDWFAGDDQALWLQFARAESAEVYCRAWLALQCRSIPGATSGMVLLGEPDTGPFTPAAVWPRPDTPLAPLSETAEQALRDRQGAVGDGSDRGVSRQLAYPLLVDGVVHGVVAIETSVRADATLEAQQRRLHWGLAWLEVLFRRQLGHLTSDREARAFLVLELLADAVTEPRYQAAATALVTELAGRLECERVSLGMVRAGKVRVEAISHRATFGREMNLIRLLAAAMEEAVDQAEVVQFPPPDADTHQIVRAHEALAQEQGAWTLCTVPLHGDDGFRGVLLLERPRGQRFGAEDIELCELLGEISWPILALKRAAARSLPVKAGLELRTQFERLFGPGHLIRKSIGLVAMALVLFFAIATGTYRVAGDTRVEGAVLRAVTAPFDGFVATATHRAGDRVAAGTVLATIDDRELKLERLRFATQQAQFERERREAIANHDRARVRVLTAQIAQAQAELDLVEERLQRTRLIAPFDGIVVSGDLSQSLGAPLQRGDVTFEVAPLDAYRLVIEVDERDVGDVEPGQTGSLVLSAMPNQPLPFTVTRINPVTAAAEGRNFFEVEAELAEFPPGIRPGMEGVAKVEIGGRHLIWIWTRSLVHWLRLFVWSIVP